MGKLHVPAPTRRLPLGLSGLATGDAVELACISLFAGNLLFWAGLFAGHF